MPNAPELEILALGSAETKILAFKVKHTRKNFPFLRFSFSNYFHFSHQFVT